MMLPPTKYNIGHFHISIVFLLFISNGTYRGRGKSYIHGPLQVRQRNPVSPTQETPRCFVQILISVFGQHVGLNVSALAAHLTNNMSILLHDRLQDSRPLISTVSLVVVVIVCTLLEDQIRIPFKGDVSRFQRSCFLRVGELYLLLEIARVISCGCIGARALKLVCAWGVDMSLVHTAIESADSNATCLVRLDNLF